MTFLVIILTLKHTAAEIPQASNQLSFMLHKLVFLGCHLQFTSYPYTFASYLYSCKILQPQVVAMVWMRGGATCPDFRQVYSPAEPKSSPITRAKFVTEKPPKTYKNDMNLLIFLDLTYNPCKNCKFYSLQGQNFKIFLILPVTRATFSWFYLLLPITRAKFS